MNRTLKRELSIAIAQHSNSVHSLMSFNLVYEHNHLDKKIQGTATLILNTLNSILSDIFSYDYWSVNNNIGEKFFKLMKIDDQDLFISDYQ